MMRRRHPTSTLSASLLLATAACSPAPGFGEAALSPGEAARATSRLERLVLLSERLPQPAPLAPRDRLQLDFAPPVHPDRGAWILYEQDLSWARGAEPDGLAFRADFGPFDEWLQQAGAGQLAGRRPLARARHVLVLRSVAFLAPTDSSPGQIRGDALLIDLDAPPEHPALVGFSLDVRPTAGPTAASLDRRLDDLRLRYWLAVREGIAHRLPEATLPPL